MSSKASDSGGISGHSYRWENEGDGACWWNFQKTCRSDLFSGQTFINDWILFSENTSFCPFPPSFWLLLFLLVQQQVLKCKVIRFIYSIDARDVGTEKSCVPSWLSSQDQVLQASPFVFCRKGMVWFPGIFHFSPQLPIFMFMAIKDWNTLPGDIKMIHCFPSLHPS